MSLHRYSAFSLILTTIYLSWFTYLFTEAKDGGFTVDLIHRDSPQSPLYNPSFSHYERLKKALLRASHRANSTASTSLIPNGGEYLMEISYGTPPFKTMAIIDTGSDFSWTQCLPCIQCYKEKYSPFDPAKSSTYKKLPCSSKKCNYASVTYCDQKNTTCLYNIFYGDGSISSGDVAMETITIGSISFPNFVFGCGHVNNGTFPEEGSGIVGLVSNKLSIISQLNSSIRGRFSYCLAPFEESPKSGKINFGSVISGLGVFSTPMQLKGYYYLTLEGITVGKTRLNYQFNQSSDQPGNIIIDSGTTATYLPSKLYHEFESTMKMSLNSSQNVSDPMQTLSLCYSSLEDDQIPPVTVHFKGADLELKPVNLFASTSNSSLCLAFIPTDNLAIFGNIAQSNFWVGYDLVKKVVSFRPADCTNT